MMFKGIDLHAQTAGLIAHNNDATFFFGTRLCDDQFLSHQFSDLKFQKLQQVHGSDWFHSTITRAPEGPERPNADAQWTSDKNLGLIISTADCLPVLISGPQFVAAAHAGWRGVKSEIVRKGLIALKNQFGFNGTELTVAIGPHIHLKSFEVDRSLADEFQSLYDSYFTGPNALPNHTKVKIAQPSELKADKSYIDLLGIVRAQLGCCDVPTNNIHDVGIDTVTSPEFASFRREKAPGRNFSFVARRPSKQ